MEVNFKIYNLFKGIYEIENKIVVFEYNRKLEVGKFIEASVVRDFYGNKLLLRSFIFFWVLYFRLFFKF